MKPDATKHNPDPRYLRGLLEKAGINQTEAARAIGITDRALRNYLSLKGDHREAPYPIQYALEGLLLTRTYPGHKRMSNIEKVFVYAVGIWSDAANEYGEREAIRIFGEVAADSPEAAVAAFPEAMNDPRVSTMPVHYVSDGVEYDFR